MELFAEDELEVDRLFAAAAAASSSRRRYDDYTSKAIAAVESVCSRQRSSLT